ncbi:MAG: hypothetical protein AB1758_24375 [Candidatus Eremiobacterota bacterium]
MSATLTPVQIAMLPNHDPMVGRVVGRLLARQEAEEQAQKVQISGQIDGKDPVRLTYERKADRTVTVDGYVGSVEVHEVIAPQVQDVGGADFFGVSGVRRIEQDAVVTGTVGGHPEELLLRSERESREVPLDEALKAKGQHTMTFGTKVGMSPAFGGDYVPLNYNPVQFPTSSVPLQTRDTYLVDGSVAGYGVQRYLQWDSTAWTVASNDRDSWGHTEFHMAQDARFLQRVEGKADKLVLPQVTPMQVERYLVRAQGDLVLEGPGGKRQSVPFESSYEMARNKPVVEVEQRIGDHRVQFSIYAEKSQ